MYRMQQSMRWFGPHDTVSLKEIRQAGVTGIVTALHQIPVGDIWTVDAIRERQSIIREAGMEWIVIESLPVHEDIKRGSGKSSLYIENYKQSLKNLASCGLKVVTYNFMPVLDWLRTHHMHRNIDGSATLLYDADAFAYFDLHLLQRPGAQDDYDAEQIKAAENYGASLSTKDKDQLFKNILMGLPGSTEDFSREELLVLLEAYKGIGPGELRKNLVHFLSEVVPVAEELGVVLAIHPDDPPFPVMGLPRVVSTATDLDHIFGSVNSTANGLCYCTGSLGAHPQNNLVNILRDHGNRVHFLHLRNVSRETAKVFHESEHLVGDNPMEEILEGLIELMQNRKIALPMRPDHGFLHSLEENKGHYPGYSLIGRLRGLAELRGMEQGMLYLAEKTDSFKRLINPY